MSAGSVIGIVSYDGHRGAERPKAVVRDGKRLPVVEVEDSWLETGIEADSDVIQVFRVRCEGGDRFEVTYSPRTGWEGRPLAEDERRW